MSCVVNSRPRKNGISHRRKIVFAHDLQHRFVLCRSCLGFTGQEEVSEPVVIRDEFDARERRRAHFRQMVQPIEKLLVEPHQPFVSVTRSLGLKPEDQKVFLIEAELNSLQIVERADEQSRARQ